MCKGMRKKTSQLSGAGPGFGPTLKAPEVRTGECLSSNGLLFLDDVGEEKAKAIVLQSKTSVTFSKECNKLFGPFVFP